MSRTFPPAQATVPVAPTITKMLKIAEPMIVPTPPFDGMKKVQTIDVKSSGAEEPGGSVCGERANFTRLVLGGGGGGRPDYLQKLKVPEGYEKMIDYSNI